MKNDGQFNWLKRLIENKTIWLLWTVFGVSILSKIFIIPFLGASWFLFTDEHVYIEMAKSFFYHQNFLSNVLPWLLHYGEVLYPILISPAYIFYSPENIVTILRIFGLFFMSSAVFPAYTIGLVILKDKKQAIIISIIAILVPEMTLAFSVVQEVIYYPLFLYALYLIYRKISDNQVNTIYLGFVLFLLWICKAVGLTVFLGYILY
jgi:hypothetical protein